MNFTPDVKDRLWRESQEDSGFRFSTPLLYISLFIILVCLFIGGWYLFSPFHQVYNKADTALIRIDETPYKVKAKDQEIASVKHQDKLVYSRIRGDQNESTVEHILPDPELPLSHIKDVPSSVKMVEQYIPEDIELDKIAEPVYPIKEKEATSLTSIADLIEATSNEKPEPAKKNAKGNTFIQLGSLKSYDMAQSEWARISKRHVPFFKGLEPIIQKVDLGVDRGIYYRLRTGPFESGEEANKICSYLKDRKVECIVIH